MKPITVKTTDDKFLISIDRTVMDKESLLRLIENLQMEFLAHEADIDPAILDLGNEIKQSWWDKNKDRILKQEQ